MIAKQLRTLAAAFVALILALCMGAAIAANQDHNMQAGKKTEISLSKPAHVGDVTLAPGRYIFQHEVSGGSHIAMFKGPSGTVTALNVEVKCTNEPLKQKVAITSVTVENIGGVDRITRIEIAGENVAHVFS